MNDNDMLWRRNREWRESVESAFGASPEPDHHTPDWARIGIEDLRAQLSAAQAELAEERKYAALCKKEFEEYSAMARELLAERNAAQAQISTLREVLNNVLSPGGVDQLWAAERALSDTQKAAEEYRARIETEIAERAVQIVRANYSYSTVRIAVTEAIVSLPLKSSPPEGK